MSDALADWVAKREAARAKPARDATSRWNADERRALRTLRREAKAAGATLATGGEGGLPPSLVLGVMRRDGFACAKCSGRHDLGVHHKANEHMNDPKLKRRTALLRERGAINKPANLVTVCERGADGAPGCHDKIHERDREEHA